MTAGLTAGAEAAKRKVPFGFFGTVLNNSQAERISDATLDAQMASMAASGVESVRYALTWDVAEPSQGVYNFAAFDRFVAAAARHNLDILPIVMHTPRWASSRPRHRNYQLYAPRNPRLYASFMRALIGRYGPRGAFWATSGTPRVPIRSWQIWNEQAADFFWATRPWQPSYVRLLRVAYRAVHRADPGATVVLGSLAGVTTGTAVGAAAPALPRGGEGVLRRRVRAFFSAAPSVSLTRRQTLAIARLIRPR